MQASIVRHLTASVFLFDRRDGAWTLGLVQVPRFERWMLPGGHVDPGEHPAQTALREVLEETGQVARLLSISAFPVPDGVPEAVVTPPLWVMEEDVPAEPDRAVGPHIHVSHLYVAVVRDPVATPRRALREFTWCSVGRLSGYDLAPTTDLLARVLFGRIEALIAGPQPSSRTRLTPPVHG